MLSAIIDKKFRKRIFHILNLFAFVRGIKLTYEHTKLFSQGKVQENDGRGIQFIGGDQQQFEELR